MVEHHSWMYNGWDKGGNYMDEWMDKAIAFLNCAFSRTQIVWCPCSLCQNSRCLEDKRTIVIHLCKNGFVPDYEVWTFHDKLGTRVVAENEYDYDMGDVDRIDEMLEAIQAEVTKDPPTTEVEAFFKLLKASEEPLHKHTEVTLLAFITWLMAIKSKYFFSNNCYNDIVKLIIAEKVQGSIRKKWSKNMVKTSTTRSPLTTVPSIESNVYNIIVTIWMIKSAIYSLLS
jgi:hypothetical protein